jgi:protein SCO1/2
LKLLVPIALLALLAAASSLARAAPAHGGAPQPADPPGFDRSRALGISQAALGRTLSDLQFLDVDARPRRLADYRGKPLVISLIYTSCFHVCPATTRHLAEVIGRAQSVLGEERFAVVTLGFDAARDTPQAMREFARAQQASALHWDFLSGTEATVETLARELGFQFAPAGGGFDHLLQTTLVDKDGVVRRQVYGMDYDTPVLIEPLKRLVFGEALEDSFLERMTDRFRLFCTVYDPASDSYRFDYSIIVGIAIGAVTGVFFLVLLAREWRYSHRARTRAE